MKLDLSNIPRNPNVFTSAASKYIEEIEYLLKLNYNFKESIEILKQKGVKLEYVSAKRAYDRYLKKKMTMTSEG